MLSRPSSAVVEDTTIGDMVRGVAASGEAVFACCIVGSSRVDIASGERVGRGMWNGYEVLLYHSICSFVFRGLLVSWSNQLVMISFVGSVALVFGVPVGFAPLFACFREVAQGG